MPSQVTASKKVECEVLRAIGIEATTEEIKKWKQRADIKGLNFSQAGLTTMIYPNKPVKSGDGKSMIPGEPVYVDLDKDTANKLSKAGAVRVIA